MVERPQTTDAIDTVAVLRLADVHDEIDDTGAGVETGAETGEFSFTVT
jgi:hypothetical protein